jgi:hypothetical protein
MPPDLLCRLRTGMRKIDAPIARELQAMGARHGYYQGPVSSEHDDTTRAALRALAYAGGSKLPVACSCRVTGLAALATEDAGHGPASSKRESRQPVGHFCQAVVVVETLTCGSWSRQAHRANFSRSTSITWLLIRPFSSSKRSSKFSLPIKLLRAFRVGASYSPVMGPS